MASAGAGGSRRILLAAACILAVLQLAAADGSAGIWRRQLKQNWWQGIGAGGSSPGTTTTTASGSASSWWATIVKQLSGSAPPAPSQSELLAATSLSPAVAQIQKDSSTFLSNSTCYPAGDGGTVCNIPVGYSVNNRSGVYYLPKTYKDGPLPMLVLLHGSGVNGYWMLTALPFIQMADKHQVIILAPDSREIMYWINPSTAQDPFTHDWFHMEACYKWFINSNPPGAKVDTSLVSVAGNSRAGHVGPPFCSRSTVVPCSASVIMHASVMPQQMGTKIGPILWTVGETDILYGPAVTDANRANFHAQQPDFPIYYKIWDSSHNLDKSQELDYIVEWVKNPGFRSTPAPPLGSY